MFTKRLFNENSRLWQKYLEHPFIKEMQEGTLDISAFKYYMIQDYLYLIEYAKVFALGITKTSDINDIEYLADAIKGVSWEINHVHKRYMERIGITSEQITNARPSLSNTGYTSYMLTKANEGDVLNAYIAVLSCSWSYAFIGKQVLENSPKLLENNIYGQWLEAYSGTEYQTMNNALMAMINQKCKMLSEPRKDELSTIFRVCSEFELRFWDMAYTEGLSDTLEAE